MTDGRRDLSDLIDGRSSVLLLAPDDTVHDDEACIDLLTGEHPRNANVLSVAFSKTPEERLALWQREVGAAAPKRATLVEAGDRSATDSRPAGSGEFPSVTVDALPADADPLDVGISITRHLSDWESKPEPTFLCLRSLTTLLDSFDRDCVLSLVRGLNDLCECLDVVAHHHLDPAAHAEETVAAFRPQYETVVEHVPDHGWIVGGDDDAADPPSARRATSSPSNSRGPGPGESAIVPLPYSLDAVLDVLSAARRRAVLYALRDRDDCSPVPVDELADEVVTRERAVSNRRETPDADEVRLSLVHTHLPKLEAAGIAEFDADAGVLEYCENPALHSCLDFVETLEFG